MLWGDRMEDRGRGMVVVQGALGGGRDQAQQFHGLADKMEGAGDNYKFFAGGPGQGGGRVFA